MVEKRTFSVHAAIIYNLVVAQTGTLAKAVLECVMNSIDAGARSVAIDVTRTGIRIVDDGQGFRSREEIEKWFEVFGFPHDEGDHRVYGKFGIGRGQLWSFCSTLWRTGTFEMAVDIKRHGLHYDLQEGLEPFTGVIIDGTFYEKLLTTDLAAFERELTELARYAQVPVTLNGKQLNKDPKKEKWDFETDDAWVRLSDTGTLAVYNLGVLVRRYPVYHVGSAGVVVTKPGVGLSLNMARNDVLVSECPVWKRIKPMLQTRSDERIRTKRTRLSQGELENLVHRFLAGAVDAEQIREAKIITDIQGRGYTLDSFVRAVTAWRAARPVVVAAAGSRLGEQIHTTRQAFVLSEDTLARFGVSSAKELRDAIVEALGDHYLAHTFGRVKVAKSLAEAAPHLKEGYLVLDAKKLPEEERMALEAIRSLSMEVSRHLVTREFVSYDTAYRTIEAGVSDTAEAWTDGATRIVIERKQFKLVKEGLGGFAALSNLLVHEYLHDSSDAGSHSHDLTFYQHYHDATCGSGGMLRQAIASGFAEYVRQVRRSKSERLSGTVMRHLTMIEKAMALPVAEEAPVAGSASVSD